MRRMLDILMIEDEPNIAEAVRFIGDDFQLFHREGGHVIGVRRYEVVIRARDLDRVHAERDNRPDNRERARHDLLDPSPHTGPVALDERRGGGDGLGSLSHTRGSEPPLRTCLTPIR